MKNTLRVLLIIILSLALAYVAYFNEIRFDNIMNILVAILILINQAYVIWNFGKKQLPF